MSSGTGTVEKQSLPPYIAFQSLKTMTANFKEHALPDRIDRSVLTNFSGAVGGQIITALRFLGLINAAGHTTPLMAELVNSYGTDQWEPTLARVLKQAFPQIFQLNLVTCTPSQFIEKFKATYDGADDVLRKSITFFINAARDANIEISPFILKARKPRSGPPKKRAARPPNDDKPTNRKSDDLGNDGVDDDDEKHSSSDPSQVLLAVLDTDDMDDKEQEAVWTLLKYLKRAK